MASTIQNGDWDQIGKRYSTFPRILPSLSVFGVAAGGWFADDPFGGLFGRKVRQSFLGPKVS